ncbi:MAG: radical SAM protein [Butyrivibrio sp.]|nr:radical SAM protein [Butyrivibrio sp.]
MKISHFLYLIKYGLKTVIFQDKKPIIGCIILTNKCNLSCRHCSVYDHSAPVYSYDSIRSEMEILYNMGVRILMLYGGETFLWHSQHKNVRDLVIEAKKMGFFIVNLVTNGTFPMNVPEADTILVSLDGGKEKHNLVRGDTFDRIMDNIRNNSASNICLYMAVNQINKYDIRDVGGIAKREPNIKAVSFNFHTPYLDTQNLELSRRDKEECCQVITELMKEGVPVFNLKSVFPYIIDNSFPVPCRQNVIMENGQLSICGRCIDIAGLCERCGFFFVAEYSLLFKGKPKVVLDALKTYLKYI